MKPTKYYVLYPNSTDHSQAIQGRLFQLGVKWANGGTKSENVGAKVLWIQDKILTFWSGSTKEHPEHYLRAKLHESSELTLDDLYKPDCPLLKPQFISVVLNSSHTAHVYKDKVVVGCQTFPGHIIDALKQAHGQIMA